MADNDQIGDLYEKFSGLDKKLASLSTEMHGVNITLLSIRDQLSDAARTPWGPILSAAGLATGLILAGVGGMFSFYDRDVTRLDKEINRQIRVLAKDVEGHESDLDQRAYLSEAFGVWRKEQRRLERRTDAIEADLAYNRGFRDGQEQ